MKFHVISHTHWDREWHQTFQQYRVKLIKFMDELIEILEGNDDYSSFLLDGQTIVLEDYLEIKPQNRKRISKLIKEKRIIVGPWYIQPDEFIPSGESLIRNLLIGQQIAEDFGNSMKIGYLPDSFGQAAQIPQVLNGFEIYRSLFWRGITDEEIADVDFYWEGPDGSKVLTTNIPYGYGNAKMLSLNLSENIKIIEENLNLLKEKTVSENILLMNGFDQRIANPELVDIIDKLNQYYKEQNMAFDIELNQLKDYFDAIENESDKLKTVSGEFRKGKEMRVHISIASTRMDIKMKNASVQNLYEKYVEPVNTLSFLSGGHYDNDLINQGWKYMLQNHAHDSICSVCTDDTHREMMIRYDSSIQIGGTIRDASVKELINKMEFQEDKGTPLVIFNTLGTKRRTLSETVLYLKSNDFEIHDQKGSVVPHQVIEQKEVNLNDDQIEIGVKNVDQFVKAIRIKFLTEIDGLGYKTYYVNERDAGVKEVTENIYKDAIFSNDFFTAKIEENGSLTVVEKETGDIFKDLNIFEESGNAGDEYDYSPPKNDLILTTRNKKAVVTEIYNGPNEASMKVSYEMEFPINTTADSRDPVMETSTIDSVITVNRFDNRINFKTTIENKVKNHRIRALFNTGKERSTHIADQQFGTIRRENYLKQVEYWEKDGWEERYYPIYPQQKFVDVSDGNSGLTVLNKGLPQYEILNGNTPTLALTLLATTDFMGKQDLTHRPGRRSGLKLETPDSLLLGDLEMEYGIIPHAGDEIDAQIGSRALEYITPLLVNFVNEGKSDNTLLENNIFLSIDDPNLAISALKKSEQSDSLIVRIYNTTNKAIQNARLTINEDVFKEVRLVNMNESEIENDERISIKDREISFQNIKSNEILNFKLIQ